MRQILLYVAVLFVVVGGVVSKFADRVLDPTAAVSRASAPAPQTASPSYGELVLTRGDGGHFHVDGRVDGRSGIHFIVDTGASAVALRESDAARIGFRPSRGDYTLSVGTANGSVKAARVTIESLEIGNITVRDIPGIVLPDEALSVNLLGMTYLSKLKRFEYAGGKMVLAQ